MLLCSSLQFQTSPDCRSAVCCHSIWCQQAQFPVLGSFTESPMDESHMQASQEFFLWAQFSASEHPFWLIAHPRMVCSNVSSPRIHRLKFKREWFWGAVSFHLETWLECVIAEQEMCLHQTESVSALILGFPGCRTARKQMSFIYKPVCGIR